MRIFKIILPFFAIFLMASYGALGKRIIDSLHPFVLNFYIHVIIVLFFFFFLGLLPEIKKSWEECKSSMLKVGVFTLFNGIAAPLLFILGLKYTSAVNAVILVNIYSLFLILFSVFVFREKLAWNRILGMFILLFGVFFIVFEGHFQAIELNRGDIMIIVAELLFCIGDVLNKKSLGKIHPDVLIFVKFFLSLIPLIVLVWMFFPQDPSILSDGMMILDLVIIALIPVLAGTWFWYESVKKSTATNLSIANLTYPVFGVIIAALLLNETLYMYHYIGGFLVIFGLIITQLQKHHHKVHHIHHIRHLHNHHSLHRKVKK